MTLVGYRLTEWRDKEEVSIPGLDGKIPEED